ncbi:MAG: hypothetical protein HC905_24305 [Bacteroidales bacterium]|nr:hypothetical protein [Bacteroidales bacterium]
MNALATVGTKGAESINAREVMRVVSVSILNILENSICKVSDPKITKVINPARYKDVVLNILKSAMEPTTIQNTKIRYMPVEKIF